ncbi:helix-turn-helix domain-containing protein [Caballeronia calidae]|uniref:helix-turn-helix domain-containing protein n=1 Tax=Caballeronia calidae TaxID=1777139 RepID=UPI0007888DE4|nr:helix-turn-helix transcriptional regulator [Caballeronia calidae]
MPSDNENIPAVIGRRVRELREEIDKTQAELAATLGLHRTRVVKTERGTLNLSLDTLERFSDALSVDVFSLFQDRTVMAIRGSSSVRARVSANIQALRNGKGWSQEALSENAHLSRTFVSLLEIQKKNSDIFHLEKLADALEVPVANLFAPPGTTGV